MKTWMYQRLFGLYKLLENQYWVKVNERLNSVFRNSAWLCLERQSATEFGQCPHNSNYLQCTVFAICSQVLGGIVAFAGIRDYNYSDTDLLKHFGCFQEILYSFLPQACTQNHNTCNQEWVKSSFTEPPSYQSASKIYELQARQERLLKLLRES